MRERLGAIGMLRLTFLRQAFAACVPEQPEVVSRLTREASVTQD